MGQKTDKIRELEGELTAARHLLRHIGDTVGCEFEEPTTVAEAQREHKRFLDALRAMKGAAQDLGPVLDGLKAKYPNRPITVRVPGDWDTFDEHVDAQIDRMAEQGLTTPASGALARREPDPGFTQEEADAMDRSTIRDIARELGLGAQGDPDSGELLPAILAEIVRVKSLGSDVAAPSTNKSLSKGDSLADAIMHGHAQASDLRDATTQARMIVNRIAAVMQIGTWDKDGTELLERAQRWENWKYEIMQRIRALRATPGVLLLSGDPVNGCIADELDRHLQRMLAPSDLARWLKSNEKAAGAVKVDAGPPVPPYPFDFKTTDVHYIRKAVNAAAVADGVDGALATRLQSVGSMLHDLAASMTGSQEFVLTMNLVILPILARQRAARRVPEDAVPPATTGA